MAVDYEWRLRVLMAENGMFKAIDLRRGWPSTGSGCRTRRCGGW